MVARDSGIKNPLSQLRHIIFTVDYEIFGDGTGDVRQHCIEPANRMASLFNQRRLPLTVFFEVEEYLAFEKCQKLLTPRLGYNPAADIREQIQAMAKAGHDIQLHLHPEWHAAYLELNGENLAWRLNDQKKTVDSLFADPEATRQYVGERKTAIEKITGQPVGAYRAGAFSAQPGQKLISSLAANGILIDSSVVQGLVRQGEHVQIDYRNAPHAKGPWRIAEDVAQENARGKVWEFPIYSRLGRRWQQLTLGRLKAKFSRHVPKARQRQMVQQFGIKINPLSWLKFLWQPVPIKMDYHNVSPDKLYRWIKAAPEPENGLPDAVVLIGHTKEHMDDEPLARILQQISADPTLKVSSFSDLIYAGI